MKNAAAFLLFVGTPIAAGAAGSIASINAPQFYRALEQPAWAPPPFVFGPVWTTLYLLMGIAAFLVWRAHGRTARAALAFFLVHLVANALWSWLFFAWHMGLGSILGIVMLWLMVATLVLWFFRLRTISGCLLVPYLLWVTFATALNVAIVRRNPEQLTAARAYFASAAFATPSVHTSTLAGAALVGTANSSSI